jgi:hypothetical protein
VSEDEKAKARLETIKKYATLIMSHADVDTVQIICTKVRHDGSNDTESLSFGDGNWFARCGSVREWLMKQDERVKAQAREDD